MAGDPDEAGTRAAARAYYRALDDGDYDLLGSLLAPAFVHERPDMTLDGPDRFVQFMREERPQSETCHALDGTYPQADGDGLAVRGRLLDADGDVITAFVDVFAFEGTSIARIETFTD